MTSCLDFAPSGETISIAVNSPKLTEATTQPLATASSMASMNTLSGMVQGLAIAVPY